MSRQFDGLAIRQMIISELVEPARTKIQTPEFRKLEAAWWGRTPFRMIYAMSVGIGCIKRQSVLAAELMPESIRPSAYICAFEVARWAHLIHPVYYAPYRRAWNGFRNAEAALLGGRGEDFWIDMPDHDLLTRRIANALAANKISVNEAQCALAGLKKQSDESIRRRAEELLDA